MCLQLGPQVLLDDSDAFHGAALVRTPKPPPTPASDADAKPSGGGGGGACGGGGGAEGPWSCPACTFENTALSLACSVCQTERPSDGGFGDAAPSDLPSMGGSGLAAEEAKAVAMVDVSGGAPPHPRRGGRGDDGDDAEYGDEHDDDEAEDDEGREEDEEEILLDGAADGGAEALPMIPSALPAAEGEVHAEALGPLAAALLGGRSGGGGGGGGGSGGGPAEGVELTEEVTNAVLGYPIDKFQQDCLEVCEPDI